MSLQIVPLIVSYTIFSLAIIDWEIYIMFNMSYIIIWQIQSSVLKCKKKITIELYIFEQVFDLSFS